MAILINKDLEKANKTDLLKKLDFRKFEEVSYMYETPETGLFQSKVMIEGLDLASIESLKKELNEQYGIIVFKEDDDFEEDEIETGEKILEVIGKVSWQELLICKEGAFFWDDFDCEYIFAGTFKMQNIQRVKQLEIPEDKAMLIDDVITVIKSGTYDIEHEEVKVINSDIRFEIFTIKLLNGKFVTIPNSPGVYRIYEADRALIDYVDKYK